METSPNNLVSYKKANNSYGIIITFGLTFHAMKMKKSITTYALTSNTRVKPMDSGYTVHHRLVCPNQPIYFEDSFFIKTKAINSSK